jgi:hypothetical protein
VKNGRDDVFSCDEAPAIAPDAARAAAEMPDLMTSRRVHGFIFSPVLKQGGKHLLFEAKQLY